MPVAAFIANMVPSLGSYRGQSRDFVEMARGKHPVNNQDLIGFGKRGTFPVDALEIGDPVNNHAWDADSAKVINYAWREKKEEEGEGVLASKLQWFNTLRAKINRYIYGSEE
ncbi:hypothetical protein ACP70R_024208 [Stipagrostis hirtigluma subsp. patula]